jgi:hypothetical protein
MSEPPRLRTLSRVRVDDPADAIRVGDSVDLGDAAAGDPSYAENGLGC